MGWAEMPLAMAVPGLTAAEKLVLVAVAEKAREDKGWTMWWGQKRLADYIGVTDRAVRGAYKTLEGRGLISRTARHRPVGEGARRTTDTVRFNVEAVRRAVDSGGVAEDFSGGEHCPQEESSGSSGTDFRLVPEGSSALNKKDEKVRNKQVPAPPRAAPVAGGFGSPSNVACTRGTGDEWRRMSA